MSINPEDVKRQLQEMSNQIQILKNKLQQQQQDRYSNNMDLVEQSKQQLHHIVESYFRELQNIFIHLRRFYPSKDIQTYIIQKIDQTFQELAVFQKKIEDKTFNSIDQENFYLENYPMKKEHFQQEAEVLQNPQCQHHDQTSMPYIKIQNKMTENLFFGLNQYASITWPNQLGKQDKLIINKANYFTGQAFCQAYVQDNWISFYDIQSQKVYKGNLAENIQDQHSYIILPNGNIFISGGVDFQGFIMCTTQLIDITKPEVIQKQNMNVKRIGHSLVYIPPLQLSPQQNNGYVYAIGGRTHNDFRTKLCERFNIETEKWEVIASLKEARSRASCAYMSEQHCIVTLFGTNSRQQNSISCEKYNLLSGQWEELQIINYLQGFDISWGQAIGINDDELLLFGGLKDSKFFPNEIYLSRKLMIYNMTNESITIYDSPLPLDFLPLNAVIHDNIIYSAGRYMSCLELPPNQSMGEGAFVISIGENNKICCFLE